jgi:hypothetical protein
VTSLGLRLSDEWISRQPKPNRLVRPYVKLDRSQYRAHLPSICCTHDVEWERGESWYQELQLPYGSRNEKPMLWRNARPQSRSSTEVTGIPRQFSPHGAIVSVVKLSILTRVCCTDEMTTWPSREDFNAPTGTCHPISSSRSRTSSLPFAHHQQIVRRCRPEASGANRKVGDITAILSVLREAKQIPKDD